MPALVMLGRVVRHGSPPRLTDEPAPRPADLPEIHPFNQGRWPSEEEQAARKKEIREQMRKMKRKNPKLYERLPLLHEADD